MKVWWLAGGAAALAVAVVVGVVLTGGDPVAPAKAATAKVTRGSVTTTVSAAGTVQAQQSRTLGFTGGGTLTELNVKPGDVVAAGMVLARIDATAAQESVDAAEESVDSAQDALDRAETAQATAASTPTATASRPPGSQSGSQGGSQGNGQSGGQSGGQGQSNTVQIASDNLLSAQQRLNNAKLTLVQANAKLAGTVITAPVAGKILAVNGTVGSNAGSSVITLAGTGDVVVKAQFTEAEVAHLKLDQVARITLPDNPGAKYDGKVIQIDPAGTVSNRLVRYAALIAFDKVPDTLLYGQSATVAVVTASADGVLSVPSTAVHDGKVVVRVNGRDEERAVETRLRGDVNTEITSGLAEGDEILTAGR
ncbi:HlyD family efflux transporter periplasmic adaptor subunit [Dactylosporangium aurantiacum]|uniref:HlyD family efflux transporter periplasmic adaptor subunit n=1 Tax=Dactylosporangium aurantiacum TaxID=35754 RepID=A0A9Q9IEJ9_9ACTN|nr:HlyD family efflux transporter periplasmic adaptor subunit [Dactylosporangium aurantiacum]MDG6101127.1 HlyD family efflux transporter periplasmic adaptor subunit [Dactylosporangium aurantiacum]UWZ54839.1 HlyD family efflux transporter periplasmic adaptor subunit [Dactylosporangium aurantiacum]